MYSMTLNHCLAHRDIKKAFVKKTMAIKLKIQEEHMTSSSLLIFSPEFRL